MTTKMMMTRNLRRRRRRRRRTTNSLSPLMLLAAVLLLLLLAFGPEFADGRKKDDDLYGILGVRKTATTKEIKQAYRRKARDTHPDKNKDVPPEDAAADFQKVVHAFEVLSDESTRSRYDRTGHAGSSTSTGGGGGGWGDFGFGYGGGGGFQFFFHQQGRRRPRQKLKDKFEVKQAMSRVLHVVSLEQLKTIMLDDDDLLERHLLIAFVTPGKIETLVNDEICFPYPFAAKSEQGIWWEDLLQTMSVRFHRRNQITNFFGPDLIPEGTSMEKPIFLFGRRGAPFAKESFQRIETDVRKDFEAWVWKMIEVVVFFRNEHDHEVEIHWIHGTRAHDKGTVKPGETVRHTSMLTHEFYVRDTRVDTFKSSPGRYKLGANSSLGMWKIGIEGECPPIREDGSIEIVIKTKRCIDTSGHCSFWAYQDECRKNPNFMNEHCALTCGACKADEPEEEQQEKEEDKRQEQEKGGKEEDQQQPSEDRSKDREDESSSSSSKAEGAKDIPAEGKGDGEEGFEDGETAKPDNNDDDDDDEEEEEDDDDSSDVDDEEEDDDDSNEDDEDDDDDDSSDVDDEEEDDSNDEEEEEDDDDSNDDEDDEDDNDGEDDDEDDNDGEDDDDGDQHGDEL